MKPSRIAVEASAQHPEILSIPDAMQQVLDFFDLLTDQADANVVWRLTSASIGSPFVVEGIPFDLRTNAAAYSAVEKHVRIMERAFNNIVAGDPLNSDFPDDKRKRVERFLERNINGIGRTECHFGSDEPALKIEPQIAERSLRVIRKEPDVLYNYLFRTFARREVGSIEGRIVDLGTHYEKAAIHVKEHSTSREIWCQVDQRTLEKIEKTITAGDVWHHRRVKVSGELSYDAVGQIVRVYEGRVEYIEPTDVSVEDLHDPDFAEGLPPHEYLTRLRENNFE